MKNLTIKARMTIVIGFMSLLLAGIGLFGISNLREANAELQEMYEENAVAAVNVGTTLGLFTRLRMQAIQAVNAGKPEIVEKIIADAKKTDAELDKYWNDHANGKHPPEEKQKIDQFSAQLRVYRESRDQTLKLAAAGDFNAAKENAAKDAGPKFEAASQTLEGVLDFQGPDAKESYEKSQAVYITERNIAIVVVLAGIGLSTLLGFLLVRSVVTPIAEMRNVMTSTAADGDLMRRVNVQGKDEIGQAAEAFNSLLDSFSASIGKVSETAREVASCGHATGQRLRPDYPEFAGAERSCLFHCRRSGAGLRGRCQSLVVSWRCPLRGVLV